MLLESRLGQGGLSVSAIKPCSDRIILQMDKKEKASVVGTP